MSDSQLFMLRTEFDQPALLRFAARSGINLHVADGGYILHAALRALFGAAAPQPFAVHDARARRLTLLGYASSSHRELAERAHALADPLAVSALDLASLCSKAMPTAWRPGARYRFAARVCPVVRISGRRAGERPRETDAFLHRCFQEGAGVFVDRQAVYAEWLAREVARDGAARLPAITDTRLVRFQRQRLARRDRSGTASRWHRCERPDATLTGLLEVADPAAFAVLLRRGLGRHRSFGFGMLLLSH